MLEPNGLPIGRVLRGKWRIDARLGAGGMATVYASTHRNGMRGALKILHPQFSGDKELRARLRQEGYVANRVAHPGIVRVLDDDVTEDGLVFLVMELLSGQTWKEKWIRSSRALPIGDVLGVAARVLEILAAAHAVGVVHRDVKPDNVFLTDHGDVKLLDFGIAGVKETNAELTHTGTMLGTPAFMSPEQALAEWSEVDARSDIFSVGATLFTLITGRPIHQASTVPALIVATATNPVVPFLSAMPKSSLELADVIDRALQFRKVDRWPTADSMRGALNATQEFSRSDGVPTARPAPRPSSAPTAERDEELVPSRTTAEVSRARPRRAIAGTVAALATVGITLSVAVPRLLGGAGSSQQTAHQSTEAAGDVSPPTSAKVNMPPPVQRTSASEGCGDGQRFALADPREVDLADLTSHFDDLAVRCDPSARRVQLGASPTKSGRADSTRLEAIKATYVIRVEEGAEPRGFTIRFNDGFLRAELPVGPIILPVPWADTWVPSVPGRPCSSATAFAAARHPESQTGQATRHRESVDWLRLRDTDPPLYVWEVRTGGKTTQVDAVTCLPSAGRSQTRNQPRAPDLKSSSAQAAEAGQCVFTCLACMGRCDKRRVDVGACLSTCYQTGATCCAARNYKSLGGCGCARG